MFILGNGCLQKILNILVQSSVVVFEALFFKFSTYLVPDNAGYIFLAIYMYIFLPVCLFLCLFVCSVIFPR